MNYQHILSSAWRITSSNIYLWVFGFFAGITIGGGGDSFGNSIVDGGAWLFQNLGNILSSQTQTAIILFILALAIWAIGTLSRIGLIYEVDKLNTKYGKSTSNIMGIYRIAVPYFLPIVAMQLLVWSPVIIFSLLYGILFQALLIEAFPESMQSFSATFFGSFGLLWLLGCGIALLSIGLYFVDAFAYRSLILGDAGVMGSIRNAFDILKRNAGSVLLLSIICGVIGAILMLIFTFLLSPLFLLMVAPMLEYVSQCMSVGSSFNAMNQCLYQTTTNPTVILITLVSSIILAALTAVWITFQSATFTIAYKKLN